MRNITRITLATCAIGLALSGGTAAVAASNSGGPATQHATGTVIKPATVHPAAAMSCAALDQIFQSPQTNGVYPVTIVSNQPDGIAGWTGYSYPSSDGPAPGRFSGSQLSGSDSEYLFSDRTTFTPPAGGGFGGTYQPFSVYAPASLSYTLTRNGPGQYTVGLNFGADIYRQFSFSAQCIGESLVGYTRAIGNNEWTDDATYTVTIGNFIADPIIH